MKAEEERGPSGVGPEGARSTPEPGQLATALREAEERYRALFEHMLNGVAHARMLFDADGVTPVDFVFLDTNQAFETLTGLHAVAGQRISVLLPGFKEADPALFEAYARVARSGVAERMEVHSSRLGRWFAIAIYRSKPDHFVIVFDDVTMQRQANEERERLAAIVRSTDDAIIGKTLDGIVTSWNQGAVKIFGYAADEIIGHPVVALYSPTEPRAPFEEVAKGRVLGPFETRRLHKDGHAIDIWATISPIRDASGTVVGAATIARDITERKRAEARERAQNRRMTVLAHLSAAFAAAVADSEALLDVVVREVASHLGDGCIVWLQRDGVLAPVASFDAEPEAEALLRAASVTFRIDAPVGVAKVFRTGVASLDAVLRREDALAALPPEHHALYERFATHSAICVPIALRGQPLGVMAVRRRTPALPSFDEFDLSLATDIAQRAGLAIANAQLFEQVRDLNQALEARVQERTAQLAEVNRDLESFSYSVSHDLRAPLRAINGFALMLLEDHAEFLDPEAQRLLRVIHARGRYMGELIDALLAFSRLGRAAVRPTRVDVQAMVLEVVRRATEADGRTPEMLDVRVEGLGEVAADPALLELVWVNLVSNALKYTRGREPAVVRVGRDVEAALPTFYVSDNGAGFDMRYAGKLFGVFQRLHAPEQFEGTGVGLATVQRIVQRHGGRITATAEPGQGATFTFSLGDAS